MVKHLNTPEYKCRFCNALYIVWIGEKYIYFEDILGHGISRRYINLLKPTGYVMHHQFNIQQLYALPTLYLCVLYLSENKQRLVPPTA